MLNSFILSDSRNARASKDFNSSIILLVISLPFFIFSLSSLIKSIVDSNFK